MVQWGVLAGIGLAVVVLVAGSVYARLFSPDPQVRTLIVAALAVAAVMQPLAGWVFVLDGVLIGAGDGRYLAFASVVSTLTYLPAAAAVLRLDLPGVPGLVSLWMAIGLWMIARCATLARRVRGTAWLVTGALRERG